MLSPRAARRPLTIAAGALLALLAVTAAPALAAPPTEQEVGAATAEAGRLAGQVSEQQAALAAAQARLAELAGQSAAALEALRAAEMAHQAAEAEHAVQVERLAAAREHVRVSRGSLGRWAAQAYRDGGAMSDLEQVMTVIDSESTDDLGQRLTMVEVVGRVKGQVLEDAGTAERAQDDATARAEQSAQAALDARAQAEAAKAESERLVAEQAQQVAAVDALLAQTRDAATAAQQRADTLAGARQVALRREAEAAAARALAARRPGPVAAVPAGACAGGDVSRYANGAIPAAALCPLWGAPGHLQRADAAAAFNRLSEAYAGTFGEPLCVTDSYRSYEAQVQVRAAKPHLAAVPGTSNHGWGTAVDLCGGVQTVGSAQHQWMRVNAPMYGWFLPSWAQPGGSKPEPWHWEFGG